MGTEEITNRLKRVEGQVRGLQRMVDEHRDCEAILTQLMAARAALDRVDELRPAVVLMDIAMPELNGLDATAQIHERFPAVRVILLSMHAEEEYVARALAVGAAGYVLKSAEADELDKAIRTVVRGGSYLSPEVARQVAEGRVKAGSSGPELTQRQREILQLIAEGSSTRQIAAKLGVSIKTVETHRAKLMERLGIRDIAGLVRYAIRNRIAGLNP